MRAKASYAKNALMPVTISNPPTSAIIPPYNLKPTQVSFMLSQQALLTVLSDGEWHSGEGLACLRYIDRKKLMDTPGFP